MNDHMQCEGTDMLLNLEDENSAGIPMEILHHFRGGGGGAFLALLCRCTATLRSEECQGVRPHPTFACTAIVT